MAEISREQLGIAEVLVPYTEFGTAELASQLHELVVDNEEMLALRGLRGVTARYTDPDVALEKVQKGQSEQPKIGHYAVVNEAGNVIGSASIVPGLRLVRQHIPLPPVVARGPLVDLLPKAGPNVHAWVGAGYPDYLAAAYADLVFRSSGWQVSEHSPKPWTVEPVRSPRYVHDAIETSGLERVKSGRFDDGESRRHIPPRSILYARLYSDWMTGRGKLTELRSGEKSLITLLDESSDEMMSRNPRGV